MTALPGAQKHLRCENLGGGGGAANPPQFGSKAVHLAMDVEDQLSQPPGFSGQQGGQPRSSNGASWGEFQVELRNWKAAPLNLTTESFLAWQHRAVSVLSGNRVVVPRLLD